MWYFYLYEIRLTSLTPPRLVVCKPWFYFFTCRKVGFNGLWYKGYTSVCCCVDSWTVNIAVIYHYRLLYFYSKRESLWKFSDIVSLVAWFQLFSLRGRLQNTSYCGPTQVRITFVNKSCIHQAKVYFDGHTVTLLYSSPCIVGTWSVWVEKCAKKQTF